MDMIRTAVNISGDAVVTTIVAKTEGQIDMAAYLDPDTGERVDDNLEIDPAVEAELAKYAKPH
jgi:Na+/H+-dicarboxylate symporter